jgi:hypothetical protein
MVHFIKDIRIFVDKLNSHPTALPVNKVDPALSGGTRVD